MSEFDFSSLKQNSQDNSQNIVEQKKEFDFSSLKNPNKNITENFENTVDVDSNRQNEVEKIAKEIGQDVDYVNSNFEQIKKLKDTVPTDKELDEIKKDSPNTYDLMKNKEDVAIIKDDYKNLSKFEIVLKSLVAPKSTLNPINSFLPSNFLTINEDSQRFGKTVGRAFAGGGIDLLSGLLRGTISVGARVPELVFSDNKLIKYDKEQGKLVTINIKPENEFNLGGDEELKRYIQQEATNLRNKANVLNEVIKEQTEKFLKDTGLAKTDKDGFVYDLAQGFSSLLASIGISALTGGVGASSLAFGLYQFQNVYEEAKQKGKDELNSLVAGITSGSFEAGLESLGLHMFLEGLKVKKTFAKMLKGFGVESIQEGSQQFFEELITNLFGIRQESISEILGTVGYSALIGGLVGSSVSLAHSGIEKFSQRQQENKALEIVNKAVKLEQADMVANNLKAVGEVAKQVKTVTRNPQKAEEFVEKTVGKDTQVFVSANALNEVLNQENEIKEKVLQQLGISNREQDVSASADSNIKIPLAKWMIVAQGIKLSNGTTLFDSMLNDTKLDESGYTLKEKQDAINEINRIKTELEKDIEKQNQVLETADKQTRQKVETFFNTILDEAQPETMNDKKWKSDKQNAIKLWTAQALVNMQKRNINFDEWYEQNKNLRFVNELSEGRRNIKNRAVEAVQNIKDNNNEEINFYSIPTEKFVAEYEKLTNTKLNLDKKGKIQFHKDSIREAIRQGVTIDEKILKDLDINPEYVDKRKFERSSNSATFNQENGNRPRIANDNETIESLVLDQTKLVPDKKELKGTSKVRNYIFSRKDFDLLGEVPVEGAGVTLVFSKSNVRRGAKTARSNYENRQFYVELKQAVKRALHGGFVKTDEKEKHSTVLGQDVYFTSISFNGKTYAVEIKVDVPKRQFDNKYNYAGHRVKEVNIKEIKKSTGSINRDVLSPHASSKVSIAQIKKIFNNNFVEFKNEKQLIKEQAIANGTFLKAPNGKQSNLKEDLWLTVRTDSFKNWFGNWENDPQNASKVVDENGEPLVVYHGTSNDFRVFNRKVNYFTDNKDVANTYTGTKKIYEVFANIKNPITINANKEKWSMIDINNISIDGVDNIEDFLKQNGASVWKEKGALRTTTADILSAIEDNFKNNDGVIIKDIYDEGGYSAAAKTNLGNDYVVFNSRQVKSINNRGSFDRNNPDIYYQAAYHGTPHRFDTFSTDKIGTGEGAQAHGWGLYFAGEKRVSERYRKGLARNTLEVFENGKLVDDDVRKFFRGYIDLQKSGINKTVEEYIKEQIDLYKDWNKNDEKWLPVYQSIIDKLTANENTTINNIVLTEDEKSMFDLAIEDIEQNAMLDGEYEEYEKQKNTHDTAVNVSEYINSEFLEKTKQEIQERNDLISKLEKIDANKITIDENKGQLFQVEIPENDVLLDEQKTFNEQPKKVQQALKEIAKKELPQDTEKNEKAILSYIEKYIQKTYLTNWTVNSDLRLSFWNIIDDLIRYGKEKTLDITKRNIMPQYQQRRIDFINSIKDIDEFVVSKSPIDFDNYNGKSLDGREIYELIASRINGSSDSFKEASLLLNKYGVKGITYNGYRDGRAYVVFDDKAVKVLETYYQDNLFVDTKKATNKIIRGFITGDEIHVTGASDISTYIHEMGHYWLRDLQNYVLSGQATDEVLKEWDTIKTWLNITDDTKHLTREQQETYARGLETYMMEGKAPSISLRNIFRKISNLMKYIYKRLTFEKVELSQDVHDYFDRLFATEQEIAENLASMETDFNKFMQKQNEKLKQEYENVKQEAHQQAVEILIEETMKEKTEKYEQDIETKKQEFYNNAKKELEENKLYIATQKAVTDTKLSADELIKKHKENSFNQDEILALMSIVADNNLSSIDELIQNVEYFKEPQKVTDEIVNGLIQEYENKINDPEFIKERAIEAVNNEKQIELLALEREILIYNFYKQDINKETAYTRSRQYRELVKEQATSYLESMPVSEAKRYYKYVQAQERLNRQYATALQKGDIQQAIQLKEKIVLNSELIRQSLQLRKEFEKKSKNIESFCEKKFYQNDNLVQVFNILNRFNLEHKQQKGYPIQSIPTLIEYQTAKNQYQNIDGQTATCEMLNLPEYLLDEQNAVSNLDDLTITQLRDVLTGLKQILHFDRLQQEMTVNGKKVEFETIVTELDKVARKNIDIKTQEKNSKEINKSLGDGYVKILGVNVPNSIETIKQFLIDSIVSTGIKLDTLIHKLDGKDSYGNNKDVTFYNVFLEPAKRASDKENKMLKHIIEQYQNLIKLYNKKEWDNIINPAENTKIYVSELGNSFTKQELVCMLLNFGNESSRQRLLETPVFDYRGDRENWNEQTLTNVFQKYLDEKDYSFVQGVWSILEELGQTSFENHKELTGTYPQRVKEIPFTLYKGGKGFNFKGGYYPLKADPRFQQKVQDRNNALAEPIQQSFLKRPSTDKGYTMTRTKAKYPIQLSFNVFHQGVADQVHDVCFRKLIYDQNRLLSNPRLINTIKECVGKVGFEQFRNQVRVYGTRENFVGEREGFEKILNWFRMGVGSSMLAFKPGIIIQNLGNFFIYKNAIDNFGNVQVKKIWLKSLELNRHLVFNTQKGKAIKEFICSKSQMMTDRYDNFNYTMKECEQNMFEEKGRLAKLGNWLMVTSDNLSAVPAWIVAYEQGITEMGLTDKQASDRADLLITRVVGSSRKMDQAQFTRSTNIVAKLFNPFASFMLNELNRWNTEFNVFVKEKDFSRFSGFVVTRAFFAVISEILSGRLPDFDDDDDNLTSWFKFIVKDILGYGLSMIPYLRTFYNGIDDIVVGEKGFIGTKGQSSVLSNINTGAVVPVNETIKTFRDIVAGNIKEGQLQSYTEKMIDAVLVDTHQPLIFNDWLFNAYDVFVNGMIPEFSDIFKRRPKKKRK